MSDRTLNWGESESEARYQTGDDDPDGGDFIVARDLDGERMLLKFDFTANEWQYAGDVDMGGGDLNSVGTARVDALEAESVSTERVDGDANFYATQFASLQSAIDESPEANEINLGRKTYEEEITLEKELTLTGVSPSVGPQQGSAIRGQLEVVENNTHLDKIRFLEADEGPQVTLDWGGVGGSVTRCYIGDDGKLLISSASNSRVVNNYLNGNIIEIQDSINVVSSNTFVGGIEVTSGNANVIIGNRIDRGKNPGDITLGGLNDHVLIGNSRTGDITIDSNRVVCIGNTDTGDITVNGNNCVVMGNTGTGTITDNGSGNEIGFNT